MMFVHFKALPDLNPEKANFKKFTKKNFYKINYNLLV